MPDVRRDEPADERRSGNGRLAAISLRLAPRNSEVGRLPGSVVSAPEVPKQEPGEKVAENTSSPVKNSGSRLAELTANPSIKQSRVPGPTAPPQVSKRVPSLASMSRMSGITASPAAFPGFSQSEVEWEPTMAPPGNDYEAYDFPEPPEYEVAKHRD